MNFRSAMVKAMLTSQPTVLPLGDLIVELLQCYEFLNDSKATIRLNALDKLRKLLKGKIEILLSIAKQEMDPFAKATYFPFGLMVLLAVGDEKPFRTMRIALQTYCWRDRGNNWDLPGQENNLYKLLRSFSIKGWPKDCWGLLPLGAATLASGSNSLFYPRLQFQYLTHIFFKPNMQHGSFFVQSDDKTKEFTRRCIALYMMGWYQKNQRHYDRQKYGTAKHWLGCYHNLYYVKLSEIPEALPHLVYLSITANAEESSKLLNILQKDFSWFPEDELKLLVSLQENVNDRPNGATL